MSPYSNHNKDIIPNRDIFINRADEHWTSVFLSLISVRKLVENCITKNFEIQDKLRLLLKAFIWILPTCLDVPY